MATLQMDRVITPLHERAVTGLPSITAFSVVLIATAHRMTGHGSSSLHPLCTQQGRRRKSYHQKY